MNLHFLTAKVLDYRRREEELERDRNPFAAVVLAQLKVLDTRNAPEERRRWKVRLVKGLYDRGLSAEQIRELFRLLDWMIQLPKELDQQFHDEMAQFEEERRMPYVTSIERLGQEKALVNVIGLLLGKKFGAAGKRLLPKVRGLHDIEKLNALILALDSVETIEEAKQLIR
jgi:hypothetical protein